MAKILETNNYGKFVLSPCNREVKKTWNLEASLLKYGFRDGTPIEVVRLDNGLLEVQDGHNRSDAARKLGIAVKYVEVKDRMTAAERGTTTTMSEYERLPDLFFKRRQYGLCGGIGVPQKNWHRS